MSPSGQFSLACSRVNRRPLCVSLSMAPGSTLAQFAGPKAPSDLDRGHLRTTLFAMHATSFDQTKGRPRVSS